jgi:hypothetical protein
MPSLGSVETVPSAKLVEQLNSLLTQVLAKLKAFSY